MESLSSTGKTAKSLDSKTKKAKTEEVPPVRRLNQDMVDQMQAPNPNLEG